MRCAVPHARGSELRFFFPSNAPIEFAAAGAGGRGSKPGRPYVRRCLLPILLLMTKRVFDINVHGVLTGMKHAARVMIPRKRGGSIVSLASVASVVGGMGPHAYTASKHAVVGLTKSVAAELGRHGVRVNCVSPYAVPTALAMPHLPKGAHADDAVKDFLAFAGAAANLKDVDLMPQDVAEAVLYLASDEAKYVSALNLVVDGGFTSVNHDMKQFED